VVLYPSNAGPASLIGQTLDKTGRVMTNLGETRVLFDGQAAPLIYAVEGEIGAVVPFEVEGRATSSVVVEYQEKQSLPVRIPVVASKPAIFTQNRVGTGQAGILNDTGCCNSAANPAARGSWVTVYATGTGPFRKPLPTGSGAAFRTPKDYPRPRFRSGLPWAAYRRSFPVARPPFGSGPAANQFSCPCIGASGRR
jgi:uncharacterized protein (TIGR03437 family)